MSRTDLQVPQEAVDALQRGDLVAAFKCLRQAGAVDLQAVGDVLQAHARQHAERHASQAGGSATQRIAAVGESLQASADRAPVAQHGAARQVALHRKRPPTVEMGDAPGSLRWMLVAFALLAAATWIMLGS